APYLRTLDAFTADGYPLILAGHTHGGQVCIPDPAPAAPGEEQPVLPPAVLHLRRTVAALARRALGRALS
ncbi:hypothetical protein AB0M96_14045, partial [Streptomyces sp. NPDC051098]